MPIINSIKIYTPEEYSALDKTESVESESVESEKATESAESESAT